MKKGIAYFSFDVDFFEDEKIQYVSARFGVKGEVCVIRLLTRIYRNGYFIKWDEDASYLFSKAAGKDISSGLANEVVKELVKRGFFNKSLFSSFGILTSHGIQTRYLTACQRRKSVEIDERFLLVDPADFKNLKIGGAYSSTHSFGKCIHRVNISDKNAYISGENVDIPKESKESRESKESKENTPPALPVLPDEMRDEAQQLLGSLSPTAYQQLMEWRKAYGDDWICEALSIARLRDCRSLAYAGGILKRWKGSGYDGAHQGGAGAGRAPAPGRKSSGDGSGVNWDDIPERL